MRPEGGTGSVPRGMEDAIMLLWEALATKPDEERLQARPQTPAPCHTQRLPFDKRCIASTKSGHRCKGKIYRDTEWCIFHHPELAAKRQATLAQKRANKERNSVEKMPVQYLRKLSDRRSVGQAMDRLYRDLLGGRATPEMGRVLFGILERLLDSGLADLKTVPKAPQRSKAAKMRPKLERLLTRAERAAWKRAIENAPAHLRGEMDTTRRKPAAKSAETSKPRSNVVVARPSDSALGVSLSPAG